MKIATLPSMFGEGWNGIGDPQGCALADVQDLEKAWEPQDTDAMCVMYLVPGAPTFPRLNLGAETTLAKHDQAPLLHWAIFDIDNEGHEPWDHQWKATLALEKGLKELDLLTGGKTGGYTTRAGYRLLVELDPPVPVKFANSLLRQLGQDLEDELDHEVDPASYEWTRLMRLPQALRDGSRGTPAMVLPTQATDVAGDYDLEETEHEVREWGDAPPEPVALEWTDWKHTADMSWAHLGQPVPSDSQGSRYGMARTALARIAQRGGYVDPHTLASFLWASVLATEQSSLDMAGLWKLACWVAESQAEAEEKKELEPDEPAPLPNPEPLSAAEWKALAPALRGRHSPLLAKLKDGIPLVASKQRYTEVTWHTLRHVTERSQLPADLLYRAFYATAQSQKVPLAPDLWDKAQALCLERELGGDSEANLKKVYTSKLPLTVACSFGGGSLYQLNNTTTPPSYVQTTEHLIEYHFERLTKPGLPFEAEYASLTPRQILTMYGGVANKLTYVSGLADARYDWSDTTMTVGVHQLTAQKAQYHEQVDTWLRKLGGTDPEGLLDWLSCVTYTQTQPLCALYIAGSPGIGKSLLARGISSLWSSPPVDYNSVMNSAFNAEMTLSPLLFADEGIIVDKYNSSKASQVFRNVVAGTDHFINAKYKAPQVMQAAMRVLITANNDDGLPFRESLGRAGIEAIVQRVMYIHSGPAAREYLLELGGRAGVTGWAPEDGSPGMIAEHLLWLRDTREVEKAEGQRFLVEGKMTEWHRAFAARQGLKPGVLQVVYQLVCKLGQGIPVGDLCVQADPEKQVVWVHATSVTKGWDDYARSYAAKPAQIKDALAQLATTDKAISKRMGGTPKRVWGVPYAAFVDAGVCETEDFDQFT